MARNPSDLPFYRINPPKVDFTRAPDVMTLTYASRFVILPVDMTPTERFVAFCDPRGTDRETEIAGISRQSDKLMFANLIEVRQYTAQIYAPARAIKDANKSQG